MVSNKKELILFDTGVVGTYYDAIEVKDQPDYLIVWYIPLSDVVKFPKKVKYEQPIHRDNFIRKTCTKDVPGKQPNIIYVLTNDEGSHFKAIMGDKDRRIKELEKDNKYYRARASTAQIEADEASAGVSKHVQKLNEVKKPRTPPQGWDAPMVMRQGSSSRVEQGGDYEDFD